MVPRLSRSSIRFQAWQIHLPERAPANIVLAQVLKLRRLHNQFINLVDDIKLLIVFEVSTCELLLHTVQYFYRSGVPSLDFLWIVVRNALRNR